MTLSNTPTYFGAESITAVKYFIVSALGDIVALKVLKSSHPYGIQNKMIEGCSGKVNRTIFNQNNLILKFIFL